MCHYVEHRADSHLGRIVRFVNHRDQLETHEHAIGMLFGIRYEPESNLHRLYKNLMTAFLSTAHTAVVENFYFDLDYRSELGRLQEVAFIPMPADASRIHFFGDRVRDKHVRLHDFVSTASDYLGYIVLRPQDSGSIGRCIVTPRAYVADGRVAPDRTVDRIRTAVREPVQLFGVDLEAVGVPFMEQDGRLLRCAHVSAWMTHYAAVMRGDATRRPSGHFHSSDLGIESVGRPFPSQGLSVPMLSTLLRTMDLPPEVIDESDLHTRRPTKRETGEYVWRWSDNSSFRRAIESAKSDEPKPAADSDRSEDFLWVRHNLTSTVARYLNSSIPVILTRSVKEHAQVIVGYLRANDLGTESDATAGEHAEQRSHPRSVGGAPDPEDEESTSFRNPVVALIVSDDQRGPFQIVRVDNLVRQILKNEQGIYLLVPLPRSLWMAGSTAELFGVKWLSFLVEDRLKYLTEDGHKHWKGDTEALTAFSAQMRQAGTLAIRTFMTTGTDFKRSIASRLKDPGVIRTVSQTQLPRYVWVAEVFERPVASGLAKASAMIVFDPTGPVNRDNRGQEDETSSEPVFVYLPGMAVATGEFGTDWFPTTVETYDSGRSGHSPSPGRSRDGWKSAVAGHTPR